MIKNLYELYNLIEKVSTALPNVNQFVNSFDSLNREDTSYAAVVLQFRDGTQATEGSVRYRFYLGYVDRVNENTDTPSTSNNILIQSIAEENIRLIINKLYPEVDITFGNTFYPFTQRFTALTAGCYVELAITLAVKDCNYESGSVLRDVEIVSDSNGVKEVVPGSGVDGFKKVIVRTEVPLKTEIEKDIVITENGNTMLVHDTGQSFSKVNIDVNVPIKTEVTKDIVINENGNTTYTPNEGESFGAVNVDVNVPLNDFIDVDGMKYSRSTLERFPSNLRFASRTGENCNSMFAYCPNLTTISQLDTSNVTNMMSMFYECPSITSIPLLNTSKVTDMGSMFYNCRVLTTIPQLDTHSVTNMKSMFYGCRALTTIPLLVTTNVTSMSHMFTDCISLVSIPKLDATSLTNASYMFGYDWISLEKFTNFGGLTNLKVDLILSNCPKLTHDSLMNVINEAADVTADPKTLALGSTNLDKLTDEEKAIATNKGWTLS